MLFLSRRGEGSFIVFKQAVFYSTKPQQKTHTPTPLCTSVIFTPFHKKRSYHHYPIRFFFFFVYLIFRTQSYSLLPKRVSLCRYNPLKDPQFRSLMWRHRLLSDIGQDCRVESRCVCNERTRWSGTW